MVLIGRVVGVIIVLVISIPILLETPWPHYIWAGAVIYWVGAYLASALFVFLHHAGVRKDILIEGGATAWVIGAVFAPPITAIVWNFVAAACIASVFTARYFSQIGATLEDSWKEILIKYSLSRSHCCQTIRHSDTSSLPTPTLLLHMLYTKLLTAALIYLFTDS